MLKDGLRLQMERRFPDGRVIRANGNEKDTTRLDSYSLILHARNFLLICWGNLKRVNGLTGSNKWY